MVLCHIKSISQRDFSVVDGLKKLTQTSGSSQHKLVLSEPPGLNVLKMAWHLNTTDPSSFLFFSSGRARKGARTRIPGYAYIIFV